MSNHSTDSPVLRRPEVFKFIDDFACPFRAYNGGSRLSSPIFSCLLLLQVQFFKKLKNFWIKIACRVEVFVV